jgi:3-phosphoshikimate 1-carboxyvinyltransferase
MQVVVEPCEVLLGEVDIPGDKSISHRSVMIAALAKAPTRISGFLSGLDALASLKAIQKIGIQVDELSATELLVHGQGSDYFKQLLSQQSLEFDFHNAGTGLRLFSGLLSCATCPITLTGDESLRRRPMKRITQPLRQMGVDIQGANLSNSNNSVEELAPLYINFNKTPKLRIKLKPIDYVLPQASAQVKSCLLLAGLLIEGETIITEPVQTRDHTERMLKQFGIKIKQHHRKIVMQGSAKELNIALKHNHYDVVKDFSSAAFFIVAALIAKESNISIKKVGLNPTRTGLLTVLLQMGADIKIMNQHSMHDEPVGDILVTSKNKLKGIHISHDMLALMIDEFPVFLLAALKASEPTVIEGIEELAYKESHRVETMVKALNQLGAKFEVNYAENKLIVYPYGWSNLSTVSKKNSIVLDGAKDHRVAMSLFIASLFGVGELKISAIENIDTSFPNFFDEAKKIGFCFKIITNQGGAECQ